MNQFTTTDRKRMEFLLSAQIPVRRIAEDLARPKSTVLREIIGRAVVCERHYGCSNRLCANFDTCSLRVFSAAGDRSLRKNAPKCFDGYPIADEVGFIGDDGKVRWSPNPTAEVHVEPEDWDSPFQLF